MYLWEPRSWAMLLGAMRPRIDTLLVTIDTLLLHTRLSKVYACLQILFYE